MSWVDFAIISLVFFAGVGVAQHQNVISKRLALWACVLLLAGLFWSMSHVR